MIELALAFVVLGLLLGTPLALFALFRLRELRVRLERLEAAHDRKSPEPSTAARVGAAVRAVAPAPPRQPAPAVAPPVTPAEPLPAPAPRVVPEAVLRQAVTPTPAKPEPTAKGSGQLISWEQWIGVRGMAVLGGLGLALAALLFYQYSVERGWITPLLRVALGGLAGLATWLFAARLRPRGYRVAANSLTGAAAVILYGALWSAHTLYSLMPALPALIGMALVTVACGATAVRHSSRVIATFALAGGFATPLILSVGAEQPIGLFGYLLVLDLGLLGVARKARWPLLQVLAMAGTCLLYLGRLAVGFEPGDELLGLGLFGALSIVFAASLERRGEPGERWTALRGFLAVLMPLPAAMHFAQVATLPGHALALTVGIALALALAEWVDRRIGAPGLPLAAASGGAAVLGVWILQSVAPGAVPWTAFALSTALGLVSWVLVELRARAGLEVGAAQAGSAAAGLIGHGVGTIVAAALHAATPVWLYLAVLLPGTLALWRVAGLTRRPELRYGSALLLSCGWWLYTLGVTIDPEHLLSPLGRCLVSLALGAGFFAAALRVSEPRRGSALGAALLATFAGTLALLPQHGWSANTPVLVLGASLLMGLLGVCIAAAQAGPDRAAGLRAGVAVLATAFAVFLLQLRCWGPALDDGSGLALAVTGLAALLLFTQLPLALRGRFERSTLTWIVLLPLPVLWYPLIAAGLAPLDLSLERIWPPLAVALVSGLAALRARSWQLAAPDSTAALRLVLAFGLSASAFASLALPLEVDRDVLLIAASLFALAASAWTATRSPEGRLVDVLLTVLAVLIGGHLALEAAQLAFGSTGIDRSGTPFLHWGNYTWGLPAVALLTAAWLAGRRGPSPRPASLRVACTALGLTGIGALFATANLQVIDLFSSGAKLDFGPVGAGRDLALSLTWAVFASSLLAVGVRRKQYALRWLSLAFFLATIVKVFLYDLGELQGLYRVGSMLGLAISLIAVSLCYQRFVFPRARRSEEEHGSGSGGGPDPREAQA